MLARQRTNDLETTLRQAEAQYEQALASERGVLEGPTDQEVGQADASLEEAQTELIGLTGRVAVEAPELAGVAPRLESLPADMNKDGNRIRYTETVYSNSYHGLGVYPRPMYRVTGPSQ